MRYRTLTILIFSAVVAACTHVQSTPRVVDAPGPWRDAVGQQPTPQETQRCKALGGTIKKVGFEWSHCVYPSSDAGKACTDAAQCEGACMADAKVPQGHGTQGRCAAMVNERGCQNYVTKGVASGFLCVD